MSQAQAKQNKECSAISGKQGSITRNDDWARQMSPLQNSHPSFPYLYMLSMMSYNLECLLGWFESEALAVSPPTFLCTPSLITSGWYLALDTVQALLSSNKNISVLSTQFSAQIQTTATCQPLQRKLPLPQSK